MKLIHKLGLSLGALSAVVGSSVVILTTQSYAHANNIPEINRKGYDFSGINPYGYREEMAHTAIKLDETRPGYHKHVYTASDFEEQFKDLKPWGGNVPGQPIDPHYNTSSPHFNTIKYLPSVARMNEISKIISLPVPHQSVPQIAPPLPAPRKRMGSMAGPSVATSPTLHHTTIDASGQQQYNHANIEMNKDYRSIYDGPPMVTGLYDIAAQLANEIVASKERRGNILAWNASKHYKRAWESSESSDRGIVYSIGGPLPDIIDTGLHSGFDRYSPYGDVLVFNEAQYGYNIYGMVVQVQDPKDPSKYIKVPNYTKINRYFPINRGYDSNVKWNNNDAANIYVLAMGMAQSKVDADRLELLYDQQHVHYKKGLYSTGVSHGFTCVLDSILFNKNVIDKYDGFLLESNSLRTRLPVGVDKNGNKYNSANLNGGTISADEMKKYFGTASIPMNNTILSLRRGIKDNYGYMNFFDQRLADDDFKAKILAKAHFKVNEGDPNIGHITPQELAFYKKHKLDFEVRNYGEGHGTKSTPREYMRIFNIQ